MNSEPSQPTGLFRAIGLALARGFLEQRATRDRHLRLIARANIIAAAAAGLAALSAAFMAFQSIVAYRQMVVETRPYLAVDFPDDPMTISGTGYAAIGAQIKNYGKTAAYKVRKGVVLVARPYGDDTDYNYITESPYETIHPTIETRFHFRIDEVIDENFDELSAGRKYLFLIIPMEYEDMFDNKYREQPCFLLFLDFEKREVVRAQECGYEAGALIELPKD